MSHQHSETLKLAAPSRARRHHVRRSAVGQTRRPGLAPAAIVAALLRGKDPDVFAPLVKAAERELRGVIAGELTEDRIRRAVERVSAAVEGRAYRAAVKRYNAVLDGPLLDPADADAITTVTRLEANTAFALGLMLGVTLAGGPR